MMHDDRTQIPSGQSASDQSPVHTMLRYIPIALIALGFAIVLANGWHRYLTLDQLSLHYVELDAFVKAHQALSLLLFIAFYSLGSAFAVPGMLFVTVAGGVLFGVWIATPAVVLGATLGATAIFLAAKAGFAARLQQKSKGMIAKLRAGFHKDAVSYLLLLRLVPAFPFVVVNIACGVIGVKLWPYVWTTALGIIPGVVAYSWAGESFASILAQGGKIDLAGVFYELLPPLLALAALACVPLVLKRLRKVSR
jgi:uncharacterized membrane protein YdjX (TVP38/TMEM64 family)